MNKRTIGIMLVLGSLLTFVVTATILTYFGVVTGTANVNQSITIDGNGYDVATTWESDLVAGKTLVHKHMLSNNAEKDIDVNIGTYGVASGVVTNNYEILGYYYEEDLDSVAPAKITVIDLGESVAWHIDFDETDPAFNNGHAQVALMIGQDGEIQYQIHSNDGTVSSYPFGTWLFSPYDTTLDSGCAWNGWHTSCYNIPVSDFNSIISIGERDIVDNPDAVYQITVDKGMLDSEEFEWMLYLGGNSGTFLNTAAGWSDNDTSHYYTATIGEKIVNPLNVRLKSDVDILVEHEFDAALAPGTYTLTTEVVPN